MNTYFYHVRKDYGEAYILIDGTIRAAAANANTRLALKKLCTIY